MIIGNRKRIANAIQIIGTIAVFLGLGSEFEQARQMIMENTGKLVAMVGGFGLVVDHYIGTAKKRENELDEKVTESNFDVANYRHEAIQKDDDLNSQITVNNLNKIEIENLKTEVKSLKLNNPVDDISDLEAELTEIHYPEDLK